MTTNQCGIFSTLNKTVSPDPFKHVNYTLGMVLGVDDFNQEFAYQDEHLHWLAREALGYGTACGLQVTSDAEGPDGKRRIVVDPGTAITPRGELVRVSSVQCAVIDTWLEANMEDLHNYVHTSSPDSTVSLYVVLSYRACPTDPMPIPGDPCRSEDEVTKPSRLQDDFQLQLCFEPPEQRQEDAIRDFVDWLRQVEVDPTISDDASAWAAFEAAIRQAIPELMSPPESPPADDYVLGSPPAGLRIPSGAECDYWRRAFQIWTVELRRLWLGTGEDCAGAPPDEDGVLLAEVIVPLAGNLDDGASAITIREDRRPYLLPLRLLQEWMLCGSIESALALIVAGNDVQPLGWGSAGQTPGTSPAYSREDHVHALPGNPVDGLTLGGEVTGALDTTKVAQLFGKNLNLTVSPTGTKVLTFTSGVWSPKNVSDLIGPDNSVHKAEVTWGISSSPGTGLNYSRASHTHGTPPDPLVGDVGRNPTDTTKNWITSLQGKPVITPSPVDGNVLTYQAGQWVPAPVTTSSSASAVPIVAAGKFDFDSGGTFVPIAEFGGLSAIQVAPAVHPELFLLEFAAFDAAHIYVVKGTALNNITNKNGRVIEVIEGDEKTSLIAAAHGMEVDLAPYASGDIINGILIRIASWGGWIQRGFMVEIGQVK